jgi:hypothetical protein
VSTGSSSGLLICAYSSIRRYAANGPKQDYSTTQSLKSSAAAVANTTSQSLLLATYIRVRMPAGPTCEWAILCGTILIKYGRARVAKQYDDALRSNATALHAPVAGRNQ